MSKASVQMEEGTVELGECTYRVLVAALRRIAEGGGACCPRGGRMFGHRPSCPVSIARKAVSDATLAALRFPARRSVVL